MFQIINKEIIVNYFILERLENLVLDTSVVLRNENEETTISNELAESSFIKNEPIESEQVCFSLLKNRNNL